MDIKENSIEIMYTVGEEVIVIKEGAYNSCFFEGEKVIILEVDEPNEMVFVEEISQEECTALDWLEFSEVRKSNDVNYKTSN